MGHKHPPTPLQTNNFMAEAVVNGKIQPKQKKAMDMRFNWIKYRECQEQFRIYWRPGKSNYADYWKKYHPSKHNQNTRKEFLTQHIVLEMLRIEQQKQPKQLGTKIDDMSSKQVRTEVPVDGHTVRKYSFVSRTVDLAAACKSLFYH